MKIFTRFLFEAEGGEGGGSGGGGTLLGGGASTQTTTQQQGTSSAQQQADGSKSAFDFRTLLDDSGNFKQGWDTSLPDDLKPHVGSLTKYPNPLELMRGHANAAKLIGAKPSLKGLAPDAPAAEVEKHTAAVREALGIPAKLDDYKLTAPKLPEGVTVDEAQMKDFTALAHSLNIPAAAAQKLMEFDTKRMAALNQGAQVKMDAFVKEQGEIITKEWGEKLGENVAAAKRTAELLGLDVNDPQLGNNAAFVKAMHAASQLIQPDKLIGLEGASTVAGGTAAADDIRNNKSNPWHNAYHGREGAERQREALAVMKRLNGVK